MNHLQILEMGDLTQLYSDLASEARKDPVQRIYNPFDEATQSMVFQEDAGSKILHIAYNAARRNGMSVHSALQWTCLQLAAAIKDKNDVIEDLAARLAGVEEEEEEA
jgi:hypothetical protein